ncbi:MAG: hypothetical protein H7A24_15095 [Leptospiraceae bacterium]|nr:hypothetical protein [Leptospiraceae bacterium]MCP5513211.1 hypothetical protein [Leptospiraceae bacterium]
MISEKDPLREKRGLYAEHYPTSNERRIELFFPQIENIGGVYLGVGTDQNLTLAAKARSEFIWLMDFDPEIVKVNECHVFFLKSSKTFSEFKNFWDRKKKAETKKFIETSSVPNKERVLAGYLLGIQPGLGVPERLSELNYMHKEFGMSTFSHSDEDFQFLRKLALENKIQPVDGDLTGTKSFQNISESTRKANKVIRIFYTSNAEEYFRFPPNFRKNILSLPIDSKSVILRTITAGTKHSWGYPDGEKFPDTFPFHYNFQRLENLKKWMSLEKDFNIPTLLTFRTSLQKGFSEIQKLPPEDWK